MESKSLYKIPVKGYMLVEAESYEEAVDKANHNDWVQCILDVQEVNDEY